VRLHGCRFWGKHLVFRTSVYAMQLNGRTSRVALTRLLSPARSSKQNLLKRGHLAASMSTVLIRMPMWIAHCGAIKFGIEDRDRQDVPLARLFHCFRWDLTTASVFGKKVAFQSSSACGRTG
jgi:hypothetical protein